MASTRWRLNISATNNQTSSNWVGLAGLTMAATPGGANLCTGGTGSISSSSLIGSATDIFDANPATYWVASSVPAWAEYTFAAPVTITSYAVQTDSGPAYAPKDWTLEYWDGSAWVVVDTQTNQTGWVASEIRTFPLAAQQRWRLSVSASTTGSFTAVAEIQLRSAAGGANHATVLEQASSDRGRAERAVDGNAGTHWECGNGGFPHVWQYWFSAPTVIVEYVLQAHGAGYAPYYSPKSWTLEYWDGTAWVVVDTRTNQPDWVDGESRTFTIPPPVATSYTNSGGSGDRKGVVGRVITSGTGTAGSPSNWVNGDTTSAGGACFFASAGCVIEFWFQSRKIIDEAKLYGNSAAAQGDWKWQGSNNRTTWTDIGGTFAFGGTIPFVMTSLAGNTTAYSFYRMVQVSGSVNGGPDYYEMEFKIADGGGPSYDHSLGSGNRVGAITHSMSGLTWSFGTTDALLEGTQAQAYWSNGSAVGAWLAFDLGAAYVVQEARFIVTNTTDQGGWKFQGSVDGSTWVDLSGVESLGLGGTQFYWTSTALIATRFGGFENNTTAYRHYRFLGVSGSVSIGPDEIEVEFRVGAPAAGGAIAVATTTIAAGNQVFGPTASVAAPGVTVGGLAATSGVFSPTASVAGGAVGIVLVVKVSAPASSATVATNPPVDTTGANLLVVCLALTTGSAATVTVVDTKGNVWIPLPQKFYNSNHQIWYSFPTVVGAGHTITVTAPGSYYPSFQLYAFSGVAQFQTQKVEYSLSGNPMVLGELVPAFNGALVITGAAFKSAGTPAVTSGFLPIDKIEYSATQCGASAAYQIQTTATAVNPTWSHSVATQFAGGMAVFLPAYSATPVGGQIVLLNVSIFGRDQGYSDLGSTSLTLTSRPIDTTGANLLLMWRATWINRGTLLDSKGNLWTALTNRGSNDGGMWAYCTGAKTGPNHTFSVLGASELGAIVLAFSGVSALQVENGFSGGAFPISGGSMTPASAGALVVSGFSSTNDGTVAIAGFQSIQLGGQGQNKAAVAWQIQTAATAVNPTWTQTAGSMSALVVGSMVFTQGAATGSVRLSQMPLEIVALGDPPQARVSQAVVEAATKLDLSTVVMRVSQVTVETLVNPPSGTARLSQVVVEVLSKAPAVAVVETSNAIWVGDSGGTIWIE